MCDEFALLTGTSESNATLTFINYPTGFNRNNCVVVGVQLALDEGWYVYQASANFYVYLHSQIQLAVTETAFRGKSYKILLYKYE